MGLHSAECDPKLAVTQKGRFLVSFRMDLAKIAVINQKIDLSRGHVYFVEK